MISEWGYQDYSQYVWKLKQDQSFREYLQQAFQFIYKLTDPRHKDLIKGMIQNIHKTKSFLENNLDIPIR
ncbi:MAG: hypothetical protein AAFU64_16550 [Bacteroidota bacterium]